MVGMGRLLLFLEHQTDRVIGAVVRGGELQVPVSGDAQHAGAVFERRGLDALTVQGAGEADGRQQQLALGLLAQLG
jgi:hypothetical protein